MTNKSNCTSGPGDLKLKTAPVLIAGFCGIKIKSIQNEENLRPAAKRQN